MNTRDYFDMSSFYAGFLKYKLGKLVAFYV